MRMAKANPSRAEGLSFLDHGGGLGHLIAAYDWAATPLGPAQRWPPYLKSIVGMLARSPVPMVLLWGADGIMIYNDTYAVIAGGRHPRCLGSKARDSWPEIRDFNDRVLRTCLAGGTLSFVDQLLTLERNGRPEQVWLDLDYSPVIDDEGQAVGVLAIVHETTDKVRAQRWQANERERLRQMFEQAPGFMAMLRGPDHVFDLVNPAYNQLIGHRDVLGMPVRQALPEIDGQGFFELLDQVYRSGEAFSGTALSVVVQRTPGDPGQRRFVDLVYQPVRDSDGEVTGIFVEGSDVTSRVLAESAVRASEARNRQILDSAIDYAIIAVDLDGRVTRWNEGARHVMGWSETEMLGQDLSRIFTPEDRAAGRVGAEMQAALSTGRASDERWHLRSSGETFWASGELTPIRDDSGAAIGLVKVLRDRTEQHRATEALRRSEARLSRAQQAGGVGLFGMDLATNLVFGTPEFYRLYGLDPGETLHASAISALVVTEDWAEISVGRERDWQGTPLDVEYRIRRADNGQLRWIARRAEFEHDAEGRPARMVGVVQDVTERRMAQRAVEESAAQFQALSQALPNHVWTSRPDGQLDWFNDRFYEYTGAQHGALDGEGWAQVVHPEDRAAAIDRWRSALTRGEIYETEFRLRRHDGAHHWHLARALPIVSADGTLSRWIGTNTDIHQRKLAEAQSTRDRDRMWALSQEVMLVCDFEGVIHAINPSAKRLLGWTEDEMVGRTLADYVHPEDWPTTVAQLGRLSRGQTLHGFENRYLKRDGGHRLFNWTAVPDGGYIHGVGRDITFERAAAAERHRIWTSTNDLMGTVGADGILTSANPAWSRLLGYDVEQIVDRPFADLVAAEYRADLKQVLERLSSGQSVRDHENCLVHKDGGRSLIAWSTDPVGDVFYVVGRDITEQRAAEEALRQAQKMEAVGQLTGGIAHDFNNLLQGINGSLDLVQKRIAQGRGQDVERLIAGAVASANRAAALTHRLLAFARRQPLDPRPVRVNPLVSSMDDLLRRTLGEGIALELVLAGGLWLTKCDPNQLESAILNLVINARDAMPHGGTLTIETGNAHLDGLYAMRQRDVRPGQYVCIGVTDTGTGMSADTIGRAFEPFFTTKPMGQGTGLGLSMIYGFARQSNGHAKIYSELGKGTTVKLYLPRHRGAAEADALLPELTDARAPSESDTVLVVEDESVVRGLIVGVLADLGYRALQAADGPSGLEILQSGRRIDFLITDIGLPGLNGRQIAEAGRQIRPGLKVLFMTGYAENAALASGFLEPGMSMITKPFAMETLAARVRQALEER